jgi:hypothetical protein
MKLSENPDIPVLEGWVNLTEAGDLIGVSRQHAYRLAAKGYFETLKRVGTQPVFVVSTTELNSINEEKKLKDEARKAREQAAATPAG